MKKMFDTRFAIMEYAPDGTDIVRDKADGFMGRSFRLFLFSYSIL